MYVFNAGFSSFHLISFVYNVWKVNNLVTISRFFLHQFFKFYKTIFHFLYNLFLFTNANKLIRGIFKSCMYIAITYETEKITEREDTCKNCEKYAAYLNHFKIF